MKFLLPIIFSLVMASANAQSPITKAFGIELDKPFDTKQEGVVSKEDNVYSFIPSKENMSELFDIYEVTIAPLSQKVVLISATKKDIYPQTCLERKQLLRPVLLSKYKLPIYEFKNKIDDKENIGYYLEYVKIDYSNMAYKVISEQLITIHCEDAGVYNGGVIPNNTLFIQYFSADFKTYQKEMNQLKAKKFNEDMVKYKMF